MSLKRKLLQGSVVSVVDLVAKTLATFVTIPVMVRSLGQQNYGTWLLAMSLLGYLMVLDLGVSFSATRLMAVAVGAGAWPRFLALQMQVRRYFVIAGWISAFAVVLFLPFTSSLVGHENAADSYWIFLLCGGATVIRYRFRGSNIRLRANVRYDLLGLASLTRTLCQTAAMCWILLRGGGLWGAGLVHALGELLELSLQAAAAARLPKLPREEIPSELVATVRRDLVKNSRDFSMVILGNSLRSNTNPLLISALSGTTQVPVYSLGMRFITILEDLVNSIFGGQLLAALSQLHGADDSSGLSRNFLRLSHLCAAFCAGAMGLVLWISEAFLQKWVGTQLSEAAHITWILGVPFALAFMTYPAINMIYAAGKSHWMAILTLAGGCFSTLLSVTFGFTWGLHGVVWGAAIAMLIERGIFVPWLLSRCVPVQPITYFFFHLIRPAALSLAPAALYAWLTNRWLTPEYGRIFLLAFGYMAIFIITTPVLALDSETRMTLWRMFFRSNSTRVNSSH